MIKGETIPEIKTLLTIALGQPSRKAKALGMKYALARTMVLLSELEVIVRPEDLAVYLDIQHGIDWTGKNDRFTKTESQQQITWVKRCYPQIAQALDLGSAIMEIIDQRGFYRELGFSSHDEWYLALDDEDYLLRLKAESETGNEAHGH